VLIWLRNFLSSGAFYHSFHHTSNTVHNMHNNIQESEDNSKQAITPKMLLDELKKVQNKLKLSMEASKNEIYILYINNNLVCNYNRMLWGCAKRLFDKNLICHFWTYNGIITIKISEDKNPDRISHISD